MIPTTKKLASELEKNICTRNRGELLVVYDLGRQIQKLLGDSVLYGANAVKQVAKFVNVKGGVAELYQMRKVAVTFSRKFVAEQSSTRQAGGILLGFGHFVALADAPEEMRTEILGRIRGEDLSVAQVIRLIEELAE